MFYLLRPWTLVALKVETGFGDFPPVLLLMAAYVCASGLFKSHCHETRGLNVSKV